MQADPRFSVMTTIDDSMSFLAFNLQRANIGGFYNLENIIDPAKNQTSLALGFRKAICHAINRGEINALINDGEYFISHNVICPTSPYYHTLTNAKYNYDPDLALEWLSASLGLTYYTIHIENEHFTLNPIDITINCSSTLNITYCTLNYQVDGGNLNSLEMNKINDSFFDCSILKDFNKNVSLSFFIDMINEFNETRKTYTSVIRAIISEDLVIVPEFNYNNMPDLLFYTSLFTIFVVTYILRRKKFHE